MTMMVSDHTIKTPWWSWKLWYIKNYDDVKQIWHQRLTLPKSCDVRDDDVNRVWSCKTMMMSRDHDIVKIWWSLRLQWCRRLLCCHEAVIVSDTMISPRSCRGVRDYGVGDYVWCHQKDVMIETIMWWGERRWCHQEAMMLSKTMMSSKSLMVSGIMFSRGGNDVRNYDVLKEVAMM